MAIARSPSTINRSSALQSSINGLIVHIPANKQVAVGKRLMNQQNGQVFNEVPTYPIRKTPATKVDTEQNESVALEAAETKTVVVDTDADDDLDDVDMEQPKVAEAPAAKKAAPKKAAAKKTAAKKPARRRAADSEDLNDLV